MLLNTEKERPSDTMRCVGRAFCCLLKITASAGRRSARLWAGCRPGRHFPARPGGGPSRSGVAPRDAHHLGGHAHGGAVGGQVAQHHAAGTDAGVVADVHRAQHFGARADQHVVAQGGVTLTGVLAGAA